MLERIRGLASRPGSSEATGTRANDSTPPARPWQAEDPAQRRLFSAWLGLALLILAAAAVSGLVQLVCRLTGVGSESGPAVLRGALVLHGALTTTAWLVVAGAIWVLGAGGGRPVLRWATWGLAAAGAAGMALAPLVQPAPALLVTYMPFLDNALFVGGLLALLVAGTFCLLDFLRPRRGLIGHLNAHLPAQAVGAAALCALASVASAVISLIALHGRDVAGYAEIVGWGAGHLLQFAFALLLVAVWCALVPAAIRGRNAQRGLAALLAVEALIAIGGLGLHGFGVESPEYRKGFTWLMSVGSWVAPFPVGLWLLATFARWRRTVDVHTAFGVLLSVLLLLFGCALGTLIREDNAMVAAHAQAVSGSLALGFMMFIRHWLRGASLFQGRASGMLIGAFAVATVAKVAGLSWAGSMGWQRGLDSARLAELAGDASSAAMLSAAGEGLALSVLVAFALISLRAAATAASFPPLFDVPVDVEAVPARSRDRRWQAAGLLVAAILLLGSLLSALPSSTDGTSLRRWFAELPAIDRVSHAAEQRQKEIARRFEQGVTMLRAGQHEYAMTAFHQVLKLDPRLVEAHVNLGFALIGVEEYRAARDFFESALALRAGQYNAYYGLAVASEALGDLEYALGAMRAYTHLAPRDDPYRTKAEAAIWEWETQLTAKRGKSQAPNQSTPDPLAAPAAGKSGK